MRDTAPASMVCRPCRDEGLLRKHLACSLLAAGSFLPPAAIAWTGLCCSRGVQGFPRRKGPVNLGDPIVSMDKLRDRRAAPDGDSDVARREGCSDLRCRWCGWPGSRHGLRRQWREASSLWPKPRLGRGNRAADWQSRCLSRSRRNKKTDVVRQTGRIDVSLNAITAVPQPGTQGVPMAMLPIDKFLAPITLYLLRQSKSCSAT